MKKYMYLLLSLILTFSLTSCKTTEKTKDVHQKLDFTVVKSINYPEKVSSLIEEKKEEPFHFAYSDGEYLYLCMGYGKKKTSGYNITIESLYQNETGVHVKPILTHSEDSEDKKSVTYPFIVLKLEHRDTEIIFDM